MAKKSEETIPQTEQIPTPEPPAEPPQAPKVDPLLACLEGWSRQYAAQDAAQRLHRALAARGITTPEALAQASIGTVAEALRAGFKADAQALTAAAATFKEQ